MGKSEAAQVGQLRAAGAKKVFREVASGAKTDRPQLRRLLAGIDPDDVVTVTRLDRLVRSTFELLNTPGGDHREEEPRVPLARRRTGRHDDRARAFDADRARQAGGVRARVGFAPAPVKAGSGQAARAEFWCASDTPATQALTDTIALSANCC